MYNERVQIVSIFKDFLIYDDLTEFFKWPYSYMESTVRLTKIYEFYEQYAKIFPNYFAISEKKFMYKNIEWKQRAMNRDPHDTTSICSSSSDTSKHTPPKRLFTTQFIKNLPKINKYD